MLIENKKVLLLFTLIMLVVIICKETKAQNTKEQDENFSLNIHGVYYGSPTNDFYEDEFPIILEVNILGNYYKAVDFGRNDWYNMLKLSVTPKRALFYYDEKGIKVELEGYTKDHPFEEGERRDLSYKILEKDDLVNGMLEPYKTYKTNRVILDRDKKVKPSIRRIMYDPPVEEIKSILIEVLGDKNIEYKDGYQYLFHVEVALKDGYKKSNSTYINVFSKSTFHKQKWPALYEMRWHKKKVTKALAEDNYALAIENDLKVLDYEKEEAFKEILKDKSPHKASYLYKISKLLFEISELYEKNKDYVNAMKSALQGAEYFNVILNYKNKQLENTNKHEYKFKGGDIVKESTLRELRRSMRRDEAIKENNNNLIKRLDDILVKQGNKPPLNMTKSMLSTEEKNVLDMLDNKIREMKMEK